MAQRSRAHTHTTATVDAVDTHTETRAARISLIPAAPPANDRGTAESAWIGHLDEARDLSAGEVLSRGPVNLPRAANNLAIGHEVVVAHRAEIDATGITVDWDDIARNADLPAALAWADVPASDAADDTLRADITAFTRASKLLAADARSMALRGALPAEAVSAVLRRRRGVLQIAHATVGLVALYREHATKLRGQTAVTAAELATLSRDAGDLLPRLDRGRSRDHAARTTKNAQRDLVDRMWTLAVRHHHTLSRLAGAVWGAEASARVPSLRAGVTRRRRAPVALKPPTG